MGYIGILEKKMETILMGCTGLRVLGLGLAGKVETIIMGYIGTAIRIHSFIPS